jgi:hypothetical protein
LTGIPPFGKITNAMPADRIRERWRRLEEILVASWELPAAEREAYWASSSGRQQ